MEQGIASGSHPYLRPTHVEVDLGSIAYNYHQLKAFVKGKKVLCVLKANAYGHGLVPVAKRLEAEGADYFGVAYLEEGIELREAGIRTPILVMGGIIGYQIPQFIQYDLSITASSVDKLQQIEACAIKLNKRAIVHLKIDTGMERIGIHYYNAHKLFEACQSVRYCDIQGVFSHFANADNPGDPYTAIQYQRFTNAIERGISNIEPRPICHLSNSAALSMDRYHMDMVRVGLSLFGVYPHQDLRAHLNIRYCMTWKTRIVYFKVIEAGAAVSYGGHWKASQQTRIVTLPVGYGDGYLRKMSGQAHVLINRKRYPVVGSICMDQLMVDIGWDSAYNGDEVVLLGAQGQARITPDELAQWADTIPYEIYTNINQRVPRVYIDTTPEQGK